MVFSSLVFICVFLPLVYILYCICPSRKVGNVLLVLASLLFYSYGEPVYVLLLLLSSIINYFAAVLIEKVEKKKIILAGCVVINLALLVFFKYTAFFIISINNITKAGIAVPEITLPIGISFFTFQAISYVADVYSGKINAQKNWGKVLLYLSFFPQLIAGPIVKYRDISDEIDNRQLSLAEASQGIQRFILGLGKKVLIANTMGAVADKIFAADMSDINILVAWLGAIAYMMQIYFDFSGYSDMAIGLGRMFGFHFKENFMHPYGAVNIQDFWHKWHISLSGWFKEYLYIPLGGNRKGKARTSLNKIIVFLCTGLWHGANWTFVLWGVYHGLFLLLEDFVPALKKMPRWLGHIYSVIVVCVGFVIFRADSVIQGFAMIGKMFTGFSSSPMAISLLLEQLTPWFIACMILAIFFAAPVCIVKDKLGKFQRIGQFATVLILALCIVRLSGSTYNPFIYFRF